ncbi:MAG: protein-disulfide reductase DsbD domain-containing protein [Paracoccaceae bacterium]
MTLAPTLGRAQSLLSLEDVAKVTILPGWRTPQGTHMAAIQISLADGWKTYWRSAGESGIKPRFDWSGSINLSGVEIHWPIPTVFDPDGSRSYGYKGVVTIPIELTPRQANGGPIQIRGQMEIGVCEDICVPMTVSLRVDLPQSGAPVAAIIASLAQRPTSAVKAGVRSVTCDIQPISDGLRVSATINLPNQGGREIVVFELPDQSIWIDESKSSREGRYLTAITEFVPASGTPFLLSRSDIRMTVFGKNGVVDIQGCTAG